MNNICEKCRTENEAEYKFCKNCGNNLDVAPEQKAQTEDGSPKQQTYSYSESARKPIVDDFDGVSSEEMVAFIGKKSGDFIPKFSKMQLTNSKIAWTWPAAILGYFLGPLGCALWFFYRKMYKPAVILSVIGVVIMVTTGIMARPAEGPDLSRETLYAAADALYEEDFNRMFEILGEAGGDLSPKHQFLNNIADIIDTISSVGALLFSGLFGMYIYKNHCIKKIKEYRNFQGDQRFYKLGLAAVGGQSGGMLAVGIIIIVVVENIITFANLLLV